MVAYIIVYDPISIDQFESMLQENDYEEGEIKRQRRVLAASSSKRSRAAEVHNLSERVRIICSQLVIARKIAFPCLIFVTLQFLLFIQLNFRLDHYISIFSHFLQKYLRETDRLQHISTSSMLCRKRVNFTKNKKIDEIKNEF